eukprot:CAMPEP_0184486486 /NCGR_PEP_ID=MMETSP0113_2-20130426/7975_1 /TAXON_ID=91329 /ORGANISM="Norrisiella sphaerica, Strain BC52" /LENGTH=184 /DNA_ID=CAMNT_0026868383 /DNA_START=140 /DNA_END=694 /DNA_ORIENTATION=-
MKSPKAALRKGSSSSLSKIAKTDAAQRTSRPAPKGESTSSNQSAEDQWAAKLSRFSGPKKAPRTKERVLRSPASRSHVQLATISSRIRKDVTRRHSLSRDSSLSSTDSRRSSDSFRAKGRPSFVLSPNASLLSRHRRHSSAHLTGRLAAKMKPKLSSSPDARSSERKLWAMKNWNSATDLGALE